MMGGAPIGLLQNRMPSGYKWIAVIRFKFIAMCILIRLTMPYCYFVHKRCTLHSLCLPQGGGSILDWQAGAGSLVLGAAHQELHLLMSNRALLLETEAGMRQSTIESMCNWLPLRSRLLMFVWSCFFFCVWVCVCVGWSIYIQMQKASKTFQFWLRDCSS